MIDLLDEELQGFLNACEEQEIKMLMVGGGAVNFHGYQRHSAAIDFWIKTSDKNLQQLIIVLKELGYEIDDFPDEVRNGEKNISFKFSPH